MKDYYRDDWNDADRQVIGSDEHYKEIEELEDKVRILEERVANAEDDEVFILSKIIGIRQLGVDNKCWGVVGACDYIIGLHSAMTYVKAKEMYEKGNP